MTGKRGFGLRRDDRGGTTVMTALSLVVILGLVGLGVDFGLWTVAEGRRGTVAAAASVGGARVLAETGSAEAARRAIDQDVAVNGLGDDDREVSITAAPDGTVTVEVALRSTAPALFSAILTQEAAVAVGGSARALVAGAVTAGPCILALGDIAGSGIIMDHRGARIDAADCTVHSNSVNPGSRRDGTGVAGAIWIGGSGGDHATIRAAALSAVGAVTSFAGVVNSPSAVALDADGDPLEPDDGAATIGDPHPTVAPFITAAEAAAHCPDANRRARAPYCSVTDPSQRGCPASAVRTGFGDTVRLVATHLSSDDVPVGIHCGTYRFTNNGTVELDPGVHIFVNGDLHVDGGARLSGRDVRLEFMTTDIGDGRQVGGLYLGRTRNGNHTLEARADGLDPAGGLAVVVHREATALDGPLRERDFRTDAGIVVFERGAHLSVTGALYAPTRPIGVRNGATGITVTGTDEMRAGVFAHRIALWSQATLAVTGGDAAAGGTDDDGEEPAGSGVYLVR